VGSGFDGHLRQPFNPIGKCRAVAWIDAGSHGSQKSGGTQVRKPCYGRSLGIARAGPDNGIVNGGEILGAASHLAACILALQPGALPRPSTGRIMGQGTT
jgi:hypothetical protein